VLRATQGVARFLTVVVVFLTMYFMQTDVVVPLTDLLDLAKRTGSGDLAHRVEHAGEDELGRLGQAFNAMAEDLSKLYGDLQARVQQKTAELQRSHRALELLDHTLARLNEGHLSDERAAEVLREREATVGLHPAALCLQDPGQTEARVRASSLSRGGGRPPACFAPLCETCLGGGASRLRKGPAA
jgi:two-component system nitrate/nitrite sensor histidine kinase NarX